MSKEGTWVSILEYTAIKKTSISTVRRAIKAGHVKYKSENGKYFIWTLKEINLETNDAAIGLEIENDVLRKINRELLEEVNDLKMLLQVYENSSHQVLPPLPEIEL